MPFVQKDRINSLEDDERKPLSSREMTSQNKLPSESHLQTNTPTPSKIFPLEHSAKNVLIHARVVE